MGLPQKKETTDITSLLHRYQMGDPNALDALLPIVYEQLKKIASYQLKGQSKGNTLCATALVHEAFIKLRDAGEVAATDRTHFFAIAAKTMRWLLTDYARMKTRKKRGGNAVAHRVVFDDNLHRQEDGFDPSDLEEALTKLERQDPRLCRVVELRQLVGLTIEETAAALGVSPITVKRDWITAKAWLARELE